MQRLRCVSWNLRRAKATHPAWEVLRELDGDLLLLQEVGEIPIDLLQRYSGHLNRPQTMSGRDQSFSTATLAKGSISVLSAQTRRFWAQAYFGRLRGNLQILKVGLDDGPNFRVINVYSPAWPVISRSEIFEDVSNFKLDNNRDIYATEFLTEHLRSSEIEGDPWIVGGDFNSSETFDFWQKKPRGNKEIIDRLEALDLRECLRGFNGKLVPTFFNARSKKAEHQIDHLYVSKRIYERLHGCSVHFQERVLELKLSDHFPIVAEFHI